MGPKPDEIVSCALQALHEMGLPVGERVGEEILAWAQVWRGWKGRSVTAFRSAADVGVKLIADSFAVVYAVQLGEDEVCCDIGSGNGWPGLALKLWRPSIRLVLVDARKSSCEFVSAAVRSMALNDVAVWHRRAELVGRDPRTREAFSTVVSRAAGRVPVMLEVGAPLVRPGGKLVLWLGPGTAASECAGVLEAVNELDSLGLSVPELKSYSLPGGHGRRVLAVYAKEHPSERRFPRTVKAIRTRPLLRGGEGRAVGLETDRKGCGNILGGRSRGRAGESSDGRWKDGQNFSKGDLQP